MRKKANPNLTSWAFIGISALEKEGRGVEKMHALRSPSAGTKSATSHTFISSWAFISPHEEQYLCLSLPGASEGTKRQAQRLVLQSRSRTRLSSFASVFQRGNQSIERHLKVFSQQHGIKGWAPGEGRWFSCGLNGMHPSKEVVNVLPVSHPRESHLFDLMRKLTIHCYQPPSLSCSVSSMSNTIASFGLIVDYLQPEMTETGGTQLNLEQDTFISDLAFTIGRGTQTRPTGYTGHLATWQAFVPQGDQSKQERYLTGKRGISCFLLL